MFKGHMYTSQTEWFAGFLENDVGYYNWIWVDGQLESHWNPWK